MSVDEATKAGCGPTGDGGAKEQSAPAVGQSPGRAVFPLLTDRVSKSSAGLFEENLRRGAKPVSEWMCGVEFELFGYDTRRDYERISPLQVQRVLAGFAPSSNDLFYEGRTLIEVNAGQMNRLTVEPGGQVEFSGAPQRSLSDVERELTRYLARLHEIAEGDCLAFLAVGFDPLRTIEEQQWFPKLRYDVMRPYMARRGARAWDMMARTCAVQTNLDYGADADLAKKFLLGNRLAPVVTAIFANSPFENGSPSGYKSTRAAAWLETDDDRTGISPPALLESFSPAAFIAYALDVPMIFAQRDGRYLDGPTGMKFGDFLEHGSDGVEPVFGDWADHLTTLFTDARLKQHIELRSADCGGLSYTLALQALWKGLMYDARALDEALRLAPRLGRADAALLRRAVARDGLAARHAGVEVCALARETIRLAVEGLGRIAPEEVHYLDVLRERAVEDEVCPADILLRNYEGSWHGSFARVIEYLRIA
ncbi:MAG TPA: glutamate-cysteine ligase family protein [Pyrinomonadaceae bacterium]|jgi:glutamate--cysteine ligase|nr:glutamate-cysteine ligase family protein [Pyrinomonadaceae bacterium]